jgi:chromate transporter
MGAVAAGLVLATALKLTSTLRANPMGAGAATVFGVLTLGAIAVLRWPMVWVVPGLGAAAVGLAAWRLSRRGA